MVTGLTIAGCLLLHELIIRRVAILRPLFGLKTVPVASRPKRHLKVASSG